MKRETQLKIIAGTVAIALGTGIVASTDVHDSFDMYLPIKDAIAKIYGDQVEVDDQFVKAYIKTLNEANRSDDEDRPVREYDEDTVIVTKNQEWEFYEWIPSLEEVQENISHGKKKSMILKITNLS